MEVILRLFPCPYLPTPPSNKQSDRKTNRPRPGLFSQRSRPIHPSPSPRLSPTKFLQAGPLRFRSAHQLIKGEKPAVHAQKLFPPAAFQFILILLEYPSCFSCPIFQGCPAGALDGVGWGHFAGQGSPGASRLFGSDALSGGFSFGRG